MKIRVEITGTSPLLLHSDHSALPGSTYGAARARITTKRKKSDEDQQELKYIDFLSGFYETEGIDFPSFNILRSIGAAASASKQKSASERALTVIDEYIPVLYDGPKTREELFQAEWFDYRMVKNSGAQGGRVPRCRPRFNDWKMVADFYLEPRALPFHDLTAHGKDAGELYGVGDGRRLGFGRFTFECIEL